MSVFKSVKAYVGISDSGDSDELLDQDVELLEVEVGKHSEALVEPDMISEMREKLKVLPDAQTFAEVGFRPATKIVTPRSFEASKLVADHYLAGEAVFLNLAGVDSRLSRRVLDFCSGVCYSTGGGMQKIQSRLFLLTPVGAELSPEELDKARQELS